MTNQRISSSTTVTDHFQPITVVPSTNFKVIVEGVDFVVVPIHQFNQEFTDLGTFWNKTFDQ